MSTILFLINTAMSTLNFIEYMDSGNPKNLGAGVICGASAIFFLVWRK